MRRLLTGLLAGWVGIMGLGWYLADQRAGRCSNTYNCNVNELATRDAFLISGLLLPFLVIAAWALLNVRRGGIRSWGPGWEKGIALAVPGASSNPLGEKMKSPPTKSWLKIASCAMAAFGLGWLGAYTYLENRPVTLTELNPRDLEMAAAEVATKAALYAAEGAAEQAAAEDRNRFQESMPSDEPSSYAGSAQPAPDGNANEVWPGELTDPNTEVE